MKTKKIFNVILLLSFFCWTACNDENRPIELQYALYNDHPNPVLNNLVTLHYPSTLATELIILGGDGKYTIHNSDETKLKTDYNNGFLSLTPLAIGNSVITIRDQSGAMYVLNVHITYLGHNFIVMKQEVTVKGDSLTLKEKDEIEKKALSSIPVNVKGGYTFIYTDDQLQKGKVYVYPENFGGEYKEGTFVQSRQAESQIPSYNTSLILITLDGKERQFLFFRYTDSSMKSQAYLFYQFTEDLTEIYRKDYPNVSQVYTTQVLKIANGL